MRSNLIQNIKKGEQMIPKGYKQTELGILPIDWEVVRLGEACEINPKSLELPDTFIYIDLESVSKGKLYSVKYIKKTNAPSRAKRTLQKHDILFQMVRPYQKNNLYFILEGDYVASTGYAQIRTKQSSGFIFQYIHTQTFVEKVIEKCTGSNYPAINATDLSQIKIPLPPLAKQERIAEILSTWDTQIQNLQSLITEKQNLKKGLCQTLLTAKTRLKGFSEDWEVVRLGEIACYKNGEALEEFINVEGNLFLITLDSIDIKGKLKNNHKRVKDFQDNILNKGDIVMILSDIAHGNFLGLTSVIPEDNLYVLNQRVGSLKVERKRVNSIFLSLLINLNQKYFKRMGQGTSQQNLRRGDIENFIFSLPPLAEQEKIAEILSEADNEIMLLEQKLESLKSQKKGIMQNLLNGKVMVKLWKNI